MDREAFRAEVATHMTGLVGQVSGFIAPYGHSEVNFARLKQELFTTADIYASLLEEPAHQEEAAYNLCAAMFGAALPPLTFWKSEAGRAVALAIGFPRPSMDRATAKAILGFSRQRVFELITDGKLETTEDGKEVTARSVRDRLRLKVSGAPEPATEAATE